MSEDTDPIVARIRDEIARKGWSQTRLAEKALLGDATIFRFFRGDYTPSRPCGASNRRWRSTLRAKIAFRQG